VVAPILPGESLGQIDDARLSMNLIRSAPGASASIGVLNGAVARQKQPDKPSEVDLWPAYGILGDATAAPNAIELKQGRWMLLANEIVLGPALADAALASVGDSVVLSGRRLRVVGIGKLRGLGYTSGSGAYLDYDTLRSATRQGDVISIFMVGSQRPDDTADALEGLGRFSVFTSGEAANRLGTLSDSRNVIYFGIAGMCLGVSGLFVGTVLANAARSRHIEFATYRAIGIPARTIASLILVESLAVSLIAYAIGLASGTALGTLLDRTLAASVRIDTLYVVDSSGYLGLFAVALVVGVLAGLAPARAAARIEPADALRSA
jgi:putative ABC transport system permease protein